MCVCLYAQTIQNVHSTICIVGDKPLSPPDFTTYVLWDMKCKFTFYKSKLPTYVSTNPMWPNLDKHKICGFFHSTFIKETSSKGFNSWIRRYFDLLIIQSLTLRIAAHFHFRIMLLSSIYVCSRKLDAQFQRSNYLKTSPVSGYGGMSIILA